MTDISSHKALILGRRDKSNYKFINISVEDEDYQKETLGKYRNQKERANQIKFRTEEGLCEELVIDSIGLKGWVEFLIVKIRQRILVVQ